MKTQLILAATLLAAAQASQATPVVGSLSSYGSSWGSYASAGGETTFDSAIERNVPTGRGRIGGAASNSLFDGQLHAEAWALACSKPADWCPPKYEVISFGTAFWDTITFGPDGSFDQIIPITVTVDGWLQGLASAKARVYVGEGDPLAYLNAQPSAGFRDLHDGDNLILAIDAQAFPNHKLHVYAELLTMAGEWYGGESDAHFSRTMHFRWEVPEGLQYSSASGVFMTAAVPEPGSWALLAGGLAVLSLMRLRRDRSAPWQAARSHRCPRPKDPS